MCHQPGRSTHCLRILLNLTRLSFGAEVIINVESGHSITDGTEVRGGDYSHIRVRSEESTVPVSSGYSGNLLNVFNSRAPYWNILVDMESRGNRGLELQNTVMEVTPGSGVINAGQKGLRASPSSFRANGANFSGANGECGHVTGASQVMIQNADLSGPGPDAVEAGLPCFASG